MKTRSLFADFSLVGVVLSNLFSMAMAYTQQWDLGEIMWVYWAQSVIIGLINVYRIWHLKEFSTRNFEMNDKPVLENAAAKRMVAIFFFVHYGFFHLIYAVFLWQQLPLDAVSSHDFTLLLLCMVGFFGAHQYSYRYNVNRDFKDKKPELGTVMFYPYLRILPMHLTIVFGQLIPGVGLLLFMGLKTVADAGMHVIEHRLFQKA